MHFNVSHACGRALYAFSRDQEIGVDLERIQTNFDFVRLANSFFPTVEITTLHSYAAAQRLHGIFSDMDLDWKPAVRPVAWDCQFLAAMPLSCALGTLGTFILSQDISQLSPRKAIR